ncbi:MAG TPA: gamma-glutamylcyclotransferase family protein [Candidatus Saccharimonadales bacterium]|nr:gamma-glutamylcyclotransferase family protein [Candidatus Saccharimonadales bacterium]
MNETAFMALYGTLMSGGHTVVHDAMKQALRFQSECEIPGKLYHMGRYPAFKPGSCGTTVTGELYKIIDPAILTWLDEYEAQDSQNAALPGFRRDLTELINPQVTAWVYVYQGSVDRQKVISGGRWRLTG